MSVNIVKHIHGDQLLREVRRRIPPLSQAAHKGQAGRVAVIGGSKEYTGAPYFSAISALRVGADLVHVFCPPDAASVIKSYSPELIVHPLLDLSRPAEEIVAEIQCWLPRMHAVVIGPGLGRDTKLVSVLTPLIWYLASGDIPTVFDADGLHFYLQCRSTAASEHNTILTPNVAEVARLNDALKVTTEELAKSLNVTLCVKGQEDVIYSPSGPSLTCAVPGSPRRCGGQGDVLSGAIATFFHWMSRRCGESDHTAAGLAALAGCSLTRACAEAAFKRLHRGTLTNDIIKEIPDIFNQHFELDE